MFEERDRGCLREMVGHVCKRESGMFVGGDRECFSYCRGAGMSVRGRRAGREGVGGRVGWRDCDTTRRLHGSNRVGGWREGGKQGGREGGEGGILYFKCCRVLCDGIPPPRKGRRECGREGREGSEGGFVFIE